MVSRTRLRAAIWPDAHVGETSLRVLASKLRATLGDVAHEPCFVRTVAGFGYAFASSAEADGSRDPASRGATPGLVREGRAALEDLDSKNGTFVDGERVTSLRALQDGALIRLGRLARLVFRDDAADPTETESSGS